MKCFQIALVAAAFSLVATQVPAQNRCETELIGNAYTCNFTFSDSPTVVNPLPLTFSTPTNPNVSTAIELDASGLIFACSCNPKGKPGALGTAEKSTEFICIETGTSADEVLTGKTAAKGGKIGKGKYMGNLNGRTGVYTCVKN